MTTYSRADDISGIRSRPNRTPRLLEPGSVGRTPAIIGGFRSLDDLPDHAKRAVVALGNFDGLHRGHQHLIARATDLARTLGRRSALLTFDPHPRRAICGDRNIELLDSATKQAVAAELGIDFVFFQPFDAAFRSLTPVQFVERIIVDRLDARGIVVGEDFAYGAGRHGTAKSLAEIAGRFEIAVTIVEKLRDREGRAFSSTEARAAICRGDFSQASTILGRPWRVRGTPRVHAGRLAVALGELVRPPAGRYHVRLTARDIAAPMLHPVIVEVTEENDSEPACIVLPFDDRLAELPALTIEFI